MKSRLLLPVLAVAALTATLPVSAHPQTQSYSGEIMDSACAAKGSHTAMMKKEGTTSAKDCSDACVKAGAKYVLYDSAAKKVYKLDDQSKAASFSGQKVTVAGDYNSKTKTITVSSINPAP